MSPTEWLSSVFVSGIPEPPDPSVISWAERHVNLPGSALGSRFDSSFTPWIREPIERSADGRTRRTTFVGPIQSGKSVAGEVVLCHRVATQTHGDVQYNWQNDVKALERWDKRIEPILKSCRPVMARAPLARDKWSKGLVSFPHLNLTTQGVFTDSNVASDSIRTQINEELHDSSGWLPGRLDQAYGRLTAYWDSYVFNISNAGYVGDQLHDAYLSGTQQLWSVPCPGCGKFHAMRTAWDPKHPELGGLLYDSDGCKGDAGDYDYNKLESTIRFQFPCGHQIRDVKREREVLSAGGRYSDPTNPSAHLSHRSYTLEAVAIHYIPWLSLIQQKHAALRALKFGDPGKYCAYVRERECRFWDPNDRPLVHRVVLTPTRRKTREGLRSHAGFLARFFALDRQQGSLRKGETPHWWLVIRDFARETDGRLRTLLVFEGKIETDEEVISNLDEHSCERRMGVADSGHDTMHVYQFCYQYNINAIKGGKADSYAHSDGTRKIFAEEDVLHGMIQAPPKFDYQPAKPRATPHPDEPLFWLYSKIGIRDRLAWMRSADSVIWETPSDVSEDYQRHMESEELEVQSVGRAKERLGVWVQHHDRNDLFVCECYIAMQAEMAGFTSEEVIAEAP